MKSLLVSWWFLQKLNGKKTKVKRYGRLFSLFWYKLFFSFVEEKNKIKVCMFVALWEDEPLPRCLNFLFFVFFFSNNLFFFRFLKNWNLSKLVVFGSLSKADCLHHETETKVPTSLPHLDFLPLFNIAQHKAKAKCQNWINFSCLIDQVQVDLIVSS